METRFSQGVQNIIILSSRTLFIFSFFQTTSPSSFSPCQKTALRSMSSWRPQSQIKKRKTFAVPLDYYCYKRWTFENIFLLLHKVAKSDPSES